MFMCVVQGDTCANPLCLSNPHQSTNTISKYIQSAAHTLQLSIFLLSIPLHFLLRVCDKHTCYDSYICYDRYILANCTCNNQPPFTNLKS